MITCCICSKEFNAINKRHLQSHGITREEYTVQFPDAPLQSPESAAKRLAAALVREANLSEETKAARSVGISKARKGQPSWNAGKGGYTLEWSEEAKRRVAERGAWNHGVPVSEEQKLKQSIKMKDGYATGRITHWNFGNITPAEVKQKIAESCKGYEYTAEQREKHLTAIRLWVSSPDYKNPWKGKKHSVETRALISLKDILATNKKRKSMEEGGYWIPLTQLPEVIKYRREVWKFTNKNADLIPGYSAAKRGRCSKEKDNWQIDHKLSITQGWLDGISPEDLSHPANLAFIPWKVNLAKWHRSTLTKEELLAATPQSMSSAL
jgi:uncharacterized protein YeaC (DUF1315 family)